MPLGSAMDENDQRFASIGTARGGVNKNSTQFQAVSGPVGDGLLLAKQAIGKEWIRIRQPTWMGAGFQ